MHFGIACTRSHRIYSRPSHIITRPSNIRTALHTQEFITLERHSLHTALPIPSQVYVWQVQSASREKFSVIQAFRVQSACTEKWHKPTHEYSENISCFHTSSSAQVPCRANRRTSVWRHQTQPAPVVTRIMIIKWRDSTESSTFIMRKSHRLWTRS